MSGELPPDVPGEGRPAWLDSWELGWQPQFSAEALAVLAEALRSDDPRLLHGEGTVQPFWPSLFDQEPERACVAGYLGWQGYGLSTCSEVVRFVHEAHARAAALLPGGEADARLFLDGLDNEPWGEVRPLLLEAVGRELAARGVSA